MFDKEEVGRLMTAFNSLILLGDRRDLSTLVVESVEGYVTGLESDKWDRDPAMVKAKEMLQEVEENPEFDIDVLIDELEQEAQGDASRADPLDCEEWVLRVKRCLKKLEQ
jgi:hypothetical protein